MDTFSKGQFDDFDLVPRDFLNLIPTEFEIEGQLQIIRAIFHRNRKASRNSASEIEKCREAAERLTDSAAEQAVEDYGTLIHGAIYEDAAHGLSAIAMLAPLYERVLHRCFLLIGEKFHQTNLPNPGHIRWTGSPDHRWNCHYTWQGSRWTKDIVSGATQLLAATNLLQELPPDFAKAYSVIVAYRNKMFHHGLEWPISERTSFKNRIANDGWSQEWFSISESGTNPWMISLSDVFVDRSIDLLITLADVFGNDVRTKINP